MAYLGQEERISYGKTLLSLVAVKPEGKQQFFFTGMMIGGGHNMKQRLQRIANKQKAAVSGCILAGVLSVLCFVSVSTAKPAQETNRQEPAQGTARQESGRQEQAREHAVPDEQREFTLPESVEKGPNAAASDRSDNIEADAKHVTFHFADLEEAVGQAILSEY